VRWDCVVITWCRGVQVALSTDLHWLVVHWLVVAEGGGCDCPTSLTMLQVTGLVTGGNRTVGGDRAMGSRRLIVAAAISRITSLAYTLILQK